MNKNRNRPLEYREQTDSCLVGGAGGLNGKGEGIPKHRPSVVSHGGVKHSTGTMR